MKISRVRIPIIFILFILISACSSAKSKTPYALIITIDGLRPDAIELADTPNLDSLIKTGSYTPSAKTVEIAKTLPSHTSLVTGLTPKKHGMTVNKYSPDLGHTELETIFTVAKKSGLDSALFVGKDKLSYINTPGTTEHFESTSESEDSVREITKSYVTYMKENKPRLSLVHFPYPDLTGHVKGWMSPEYLNSIADVDKALGTIIASLKDEGIYETMFIVILSDHGGQGINHGDDIPHSVQIPWLALGKNVKKNYAVKEQVYIYDTAPTVLRALGLKPPPDIDGRVIEEIFVNGHN